MNQMQHRAPANEQGMILATALVFLVFLTIIGVTAMQSSNMQEKMASNTQQLNRAFHGAEAGITAALDFASQNKVTIASTPTTENTLVTYDGVTVETDMIYEAEAKTPPTGYSLRGSFKAHNFYIDSKAKTTDGAGSGHLRGFYVVGPGAGS